MVVSRQHWPQSFQQREGRGPHPAPQPSRPRLGRQMSEWFRGRLLGPATWETLGQGPSTPVPQFPKQEASKVCFMVRLWN